MITIRKLLSLKPKLRIKKIAYIFYNFAREIEKDKIIDRFFLDEIFKIIRNEILLANLFECITLKYQVLLHSQKDDRIRALDSLYYVLMKELGENPADWDFSGYSPNGPRKIFPMQLYLDDLRSPYNVGSIFRTANVFGVEKILLSPDCPTPDHNRAKRIAMGCIDSMEWQVSDLDSLIFPVFALETGGHDINTFSFPDSGTLIIGSEELGISSQARAMAAESAGIVSIPMCGTKGSLNVSVAVGIALQHWFYRKFSLMA